MELNLNLNFKNLRIEEYGRKPDEHIIVMKGYGDVII